MDEPTQGEEMAMRRLLGKVKRAMNPVRSVTKTEPVALAGGLPAGGKLMAFKKRSKGVKPAKRFAYRDQKGELKASINGGQAQPVTVKPIKFPKSRGVRITPKMPRLRR